jgi:hypothetical protein
MIELRGVLNAAEEVESFFRTKSWSFCFIGGIAVQRWAQFLSRNVRFQGRHRGLGPKGI